MIIGNARLTAVPALLALATSLVARRSALSVRLGLDMMQSPDFHRMMNGRRKKQTSGAWAHSRMAQDAPEVLRGSRRSLGIFGGVPEHDLTRAAPGLSWRNLEGDVPAPDSADCWREVTKARGGG